MKFGNRRYKDVARVEHGVEGGIFSTIMGYS